jgi:uncharacterized membrane protein
MPFQIASLVGAALILLAYGAHQAGRMGRDSRAYHVINAVGAGLLLVVAVQTRQAGFVILEGVWTAISVWALLRLRRGSAAAPR